MDSTEKTILRYDLKVCVNRYKHVITSIKKGKYPRDALYFYWKFGADDVVFGLYTELVFYAPFGIVSYVTNGKILRRYRF